MSTAAVAQVLASILNDDIDFSSAAQDVKDSFRGPPTKTIFKTDELIYRFISIRDVEYRDGTKQGSPLFESAWWVPAETFRAVTKRAFRTKQSFTEAARAGLAVTREWNPHMDWIVIARMKDPVYGWVGPTAGQREYKDDAQVWLIGGLDQIWMPGLAGGGNGTSSPYAFLEFCGAVDE